MSGTEDECDRYRVALERILDIGEDPTSNRRDMLVAFKIADEALNVSTMPTMAAKKASGENIEEWQRNTVRVRVPKAMAEALAKRWRLTVPEAVIRAVKEALDE